MLVGDQFSLPGQRLQRFFLQNGLIPFEIIEHRGLENEESGVDPSSVAFRFLLECDHIVPLREFHRAEPPARLARSHCGQLPVRPVKRHELTNVHI